MKAIKVIINIFSLALLTSCSISRPFSGPKYDSNTRKLMVPDDQIVVLAITNGKLFRSLRRPFDKKTQEIYKNIKENPGYIGASIRLKLLGNEVWTQSVWESEEALDNFVNGRRHVDAMYMTDQAIMEMRSLRLEVKAGELPYSWDRIVEILKKTPFKKYNPL